MKKLFYLVTILLGLNASAQVGIGVPTTNINPSAELEVASTTKGFLAPRMTETQKNAISDPAMGLLVYQTDGNIGFYYFDGSVWKNGLGSEGVAGTNGSSAYQVAVANGFVGSEVQWLASLVGTNGTNGTNGSSAYQVAVANGYVGTETQWLASLVGINGTNGTDKTEDSYFKIIAILI